MANSIVWTMLLLFLTVYGKGEETCENTFNLFGCYEEGSPGDVLINDRENIKWGDITSYMKGLACKCSKLAKKEGFAGFALHYYGECYGRSAAQLEILKSNTHQGRKCVGDQTYKVCDKTKHDYCTGVDGAEAVYEFKSSSEENINGGLGEWLNWTACDKECGSGYRQRERNCDNPLPKGNGKDCTGLGNLTQTEACKVKECPVDGGWSPYGNYGKCSKDCGGGFKIRSRTCTNPTPAYGGEPCAGNSEESVTCNTQKCPVDGGWSAFGTYGKCSKKCGGGTKERSRSCNNPTPANGGKQCLGSSVESASCNNKPCPVNGGWSAFGTYGKCSKKCDGGVKKRKRFCNNPTPRYGGNGCKGTSEQSVQCNTHKCPDIVNCRTKYTRYQTHSNGKMVYLDRHRMNCGGTGYVSSMFRLQRRGRKMRYKFRCCNFKDKAVCRLVRKVTSFSKDGGGDAVFLDRHSANCGRNGFINDIRVQRNSRHNKIRYNYYCCQLKGKWRGRSSCYTKNTRMTYDGNGKVYYLDRQTVRCISGYGLSYFKLYRNSRHDRWAYNYRCCKVNH